MRRQIRSNRPTTNNNLSAPDTSMASAKGRGHPRNFWAHQPQNHISAPSSTTLGESGVVSTRSSGRTGSIESTFFSKARTCDITEINLSNLPWPEILKHIAKTKIKMTQRVTHCESQGLQVTSEVVKLTNSSHRNKTKTRVRGARRAFDRTKTQSMPNCPAHLQV